MSAEGPVAPFLAALADRVGTAALDEEEATLVLRLAKVVADWSERRHAPLTAYAAGLVIGAAAPDRVERLRTLVAAIEGVAEGGGDPVVPPGATS